MDKEEITPEIQRTLDRLAEILLDICIQRRREKMEAEKQNLRGKS